ncbi:MAG TPA: maleylacetoacetate isomerase [Sphingobium sp.]|uniref:maleylacetoacetate isomerase n=1 Tax=Sphingobium sp. TaxID=1912891 RepID=UPI002ED19B02
MSALILHSYWRSSAAYRVRIALNYKGIDYAQITHDLRTGAQRDGDYLAIAPHGLIPVIEYGGRRFIESPALMEWIEARWPTPPLLPPDPDDAAIVRAMASLIACDIHPINNLRVLDSLRRDLAASQEQVQQWVARWTGRGLAALEVLIAEHGGRFAFGDTPTFADCFLVPQLYNAERFSVDLTPFPHVVAAGAAARALPAFSLAHPSVQPDADD